MMMGIAQSFVLPYLFMTIHSIYPFFFLFVKSASSTRLHDKLTILKTLQFAVCLICLCVSSITNDLSLVHFLGFFNWQFSFFTDFFFFFVIVFQFLSIIINIFYFYFFFIFKIIISLILKKKKKKKKKNE